MLERDYQRTRAFEVKSGLAVRAAGNLAGRLWVRVERDRAGAEAMTAAFARGNAAAV